MYIMFQVQCTGLITNTTRIKLVGPLDQFGNWQVQKSLPLERTKELGWYRALVMINESKLPFEYKYVLHDEADDNVLWESGSNRLFESSTSNQMIALIVVSDYFHM